MGKRVLIIGGGVAGLSAAVRLAASGLGFQVTLLEASEHVGGRLHAVRIPHPTRPNEAPFVFDTDPSPLTTPYVILDLFAAAKQDVRDHLQIVKLDPVRRYCWADGTYFDVFDDEAQLLQSIATISKDDMPGWMRLLSTCRRAWEADQRAGEREGSLSRLGGAVDRVRRLGTMLRMAVQPTAATAVNRYLHHPKLRAVWRYELARCGLDVDVLAGSHLVQRWLEHEYGLWHIVGGMHMLIERLEKMAQNLGVEIRCNCPVERVIPGQTTSIGPDWNRGVCLREGSEILADVTLPSVDAERKRGYSTLLLGIEADLSLPHRTTLFMKDPRNASSCVEVACPTRTDPSLAPQRCLALMVQSPARMGRDDVVPLLEQRLGLSELKQRIVVERFIAADEPGNETVHPCITEELLRGKALSDSAKQRLA